MVATKTIVIAAIIVAVCVTALVVGIVLGTRSSKCSDAASLPVNATVDSSFSNNLYSVTVNWFVPSEDEDCEVWYWVNYEYEQNGQYFNLTRNVTMLNDTSVPIFSIQPCVEVTFHIWPVNEDGEMSPDPKTLTYTTPLSSINAPTNVQVSDEGDDLEVSWQRPANLGECAVNYQLTITRDAATANPVTTNLLTYPVLDNSFCIRASISITASSTGLTSSPVVVEYTTPAVTGFAVAPSTTNNNQLVATWDPLPKECTPQYRIIRTVDGDKLDPVVASSPYSFDFDYCLEIQLSITAFLGDFETESATTPPRTQNPTELDEVTNVRIEERVITWEAPARYTTCALTYILTASSDDEEAEPLAVTATQLALADIPYCFNLYDVVVQAVYNEVRSTASEAFSFTDDAQIHGLEVETVSGQYSISWDPHPKESECNIQYQVAYDIDGVEDDLNEFNTAITIPTHDFEKLYCVSGTFSVTAFGDGDLKGETLEEPLEEFQSATIINLRANSVGLVEWDEIVELARCEISYQVSYNTDTGVQNRLPPIQDNSFKVPRDEFCATFDISVAPIVSGEVGNAQTITVVVLPTVENFEAERTSDSNQILTSWGFPNSACSVQYTIVQTLNGDALDAIHTTENVYSFVSSYCADMEFSITALVDIYQSPVETATVDREDPTEVEAVENAEVDEDGVVTWEAPARYTACPLMYTLSVSIDGGTPENMLPTSETRYALTDISHCFRVDVVLVAVYEDISGTPIDVSYSEAVTNLKVETVGDQYRATWETHPRASECNVQYRVTYDIEGVEGDPSEFTETTRDTFYEFEKLYCVSGTFSVTAFGDGDLTGETLEEPLEEFQSATIINLRANSDGLVEWDEIVELARCEISYQVSYNTDTGVENRLASIQDNSFQVPRDEFCATFDIRVAPIVSGKVGDEEEITVVVLPTVENFEAERTSDGNQILTSWGFPNSACSVQYTIVQTLNGDALDPIHTTENKYSFVSSYCADIEFSITALVDIYQSPVETATVDREDPTEVEAVENAEIDKDGVVTWEAPARYTACLLTYTLSVSIDGGTPENMSPTSETRYALTDISHCFRVDVVLEAVYEDISGTQNDVSYSEAVTNLKVETVDDQYRATWDTHPTESECNVQYRVTYDIEGVEGDPSEFTITTSDTFYEFEKLYCTEGKLSVTAFGDDLEAEAKEISLLEPQPTTILNPRISNGQVIWDPVEAVARCVIQYQVIYITDASGQHWPPPIEQNSFTVPSVNYCFTYDITVAPLVSGVVGIAERASFAVVPEVTNLKVEKSTDGEEVVVSWDPFHNLNCEVEYKIVQKIDGQETELPNTSLNEHSVDFSMCVDYEFTITPVVGTTEYDSVTSVPFREDPTAADVVQNVRIDNGMIRWDAPLGNTECSLSYLVRVSSDSAASEDHGVDKTEFALADITYCFKLEVSILAVYGDISSDPTEALTVEEVPAVTNLKVEKSTDGESVDVSWDAFHNLNCEVEYKIVQKINGQETAVPNTSSNGHSVDFNLCVDYEFTITPVVGTTEYDSVPSEPFREGPAVIDQVQNMRIDNGVIRWDAPSGNPECSFSYLVRASSDSAAPVDHPVDDTEFPLADITYCFKLDISVIAVYDDISSEPTEALPVEEVPKVTNLKVEKSTDGESVDVSWDAFHNLNCEVEYKIVQKINGQETAVPNTSSNRHSVDFNFCVDYEFTITPVVGTTEYDSVTSVPFREDPTVIDVAENVRIETGMIKWEVPSGYEECSLSYVVRTSSDNAAPVNHDADNTEFALAGILYCFKLDIFVIAVYDDISSESTEAVTVEEVPAVTNLKVEKSTDGESVDVSWDAFHNLNCEVEYKIVQKINGQETAVPNTSSNGHSVDFNLCVDYEFTITPVVGITEYDSVPSEPFREDPAVIDVVQNVIIDNGVIRWDAPSGNPECSFSYLVRASSDSAAPVDHPVDDTEFPLADITYCFKLDISVIAVYDDISSEPTEALPVEEDLSIDVKIDPSSLTNRVAVTWTPHEKQVQCDIEYTASSSIAGIEDQIAAVGEDIVYLDIAYCTSDTITVRATTSIAGVVLIGSDSYEPIPPVAMGEVQQIETEPVDEDSFRLTWSPPPYVDRCELIYTVTVNVPSNPSYDDSCEDTTEAECTLQEACDIMDINIRTDYVHDTEVFFATPYRYTCDTNIRVILTQER